MSEQERKRRNEMMVIIVVSAIAVLVLLGAGLFGTVGLEEQTEQSRKAACQSNLKELDLAVLMYCQDFDQRFPMAYNWSDAVYPYVMNQEVYVCPSMPYMPCGYAYNVYLDRLELKKLKRPSNTVVSWDAVGGWNLAGDATLADPRHDGGLNLAFSDGHVKWLEQSQLSAYTWGPLRAGAGTAGSSATQP
jgi:prepilin-type processing-associated H-X9-DG protein